MSSKHKVGDGMVKKGYEFWDSAYKLQILIEGNSS